MKAVVQQGVDWLSATLPGRRRRLLKRVTRGYLNSRDFNGVGVPRYTRTSTLMDLVRSGVVSVNRGDRHPNTHIKAFAPEPVEEQIAKILADGLGGGLYPEPKHLTEVVNRRKYEGRPFSLRLALGEPQLDLAYFDLAILETYRNDPRYGFDVDDVHGSIHVTDEYFESDAMHDRDQTFLQTFGFAYDKERNRYVCVFLRYLHDLTPEHQRLWEAREVTGDMFPHPDYWRTSMGSFPEKASVFVAFCEELGVCNEMASLMGKPQLFRSDFKESRPRDFAFLLRPTLREFNQFVQLLDRMMSDNLNREFFRGDIDLETDEARKDGKVVVRQKGTIQLLDEWLNRVDFQDPEPRNNMIRTFRKVRRLRQKPAHAVQDDAFDQKYGHEQRELVVEAYGAVRTMRLILANHPATKACEIPEWLYKGEVWPF